MSQLSKDLKWTTALAVVLALAGTVMTSADSRLRDAVSTPPLAYTYAYCPDYDSSGCFLPGTRVVTPYSATAGHVDSSPTWSPDADEIALARGGDIAVMNVATGALVNITNTASWEWSPAWSPDGQRIAFWSDRSGPYEVYLMDPDGSNVVPVTTNSGTGSRLSWSPDSTRLAYTCTVDTGNEDVCAINVDGTGFLRLTNDPARDVSPAWSPDGGAIAFATDRNGELQLATMSPDGGGEAIIGGGVSGWDPAWSPDGRQIAFTVVDYGALFGLAISTMFADGSGVSVVAYDASEPAWMPTSPFANFSVACSGLTCTVDATGSIGNITGYAWNFGDQTTGTGGVVSHTYAAGGNFLITLTVTDDGGATSSSQESVFLNQPPVAAFTVSCDQTLTCLLDPTSSTDPTGPIVVVQWSFGDGSHAYCDGWTVCLVALQHVYVAAGSYTATLQVTDAYGATSTTSRTFTVTTPIMHVGDIDRATTTPKGKWSATVTISVHNGSHQPVANALVTASWGTGGAVSCTTNAAGSCAFTKSNLTPQTKLTLTVTNVQKASFVYQSQSNHDPDGDSNGTTIQISK